jgi:hypothetical protein
MQSLPNTTESDSDGTFDSEIESVEDASGWNDDLLDRKYENCLKIKQLDSRLIQLANERFSLARVFSDYQIAFSQQYSPSGWTHKATCPFPDHNDKTPSFAYNPSENRFNCLGCQRGGKIVQFIAYMENKKQTEVAYDLLKNILDDENFIIEDVYDNKEQEKILNILLEYTKVLTSFVEKHNNSLKAIKIAETVSLPLDLYVRNHLPTGSINIEQLLGRIKKIKKHLDDF